MNFQIIFYKYTHWKYHKKMFCPSGRSVPTEVLFLRTFCLSQCFVSRHYVFWRFVCGRFVPPDLCSLRTFCLCATCKWSALSSLQVGDLFFPAFQPKWSVSLTYQSVKCPPTWQLLIFPPACQYVICPIACQKVICPLSLLVNDLSLLPTYQ